MARRSATSCSSRSLRAARYSADSLGNAMGMACRPPVRSGLIALMLHGGAPMLDVVSSIDGFSVSSLVMAQAAQQQLAANVVDTLLPTASPQPAPGVKLDLSPAAQALL